MTEVRELSENAQSPILVTLFGMVTEVRELPSNAQSPILVTAVPSIVLGITTYFEHIS